MGVADTVDFDLRPLRPMLVVVCEMRPPKVEAKAICVINPVTDQSESGPNVALDLRRTLLWLDAAAATAVVTAAAATFNTDADVNVDATVAIGVVGAVAEVSRQIWRPS
ncbi:hypothetical protein BASA81_013471 [Batrachochytrium salamandrivorans]|nr:hypothetical protein BASA81_013471 [Batrachochytrium salamandrivorans]